LILLAGRAGIHEELALQCQELDLDYVRIIEAGTIDGGHPFP